MIPCSFSDDASITSLTVQIFTVKSIAHKLLEEEDAFAIMARYYKEHMKSRVFDSEGTYINELIIDYLTGLDG